MNIAVLIVKLLDPTIILVSLIGAIATRRLLFAPQIAILAASAQETVLYYLDPFRIWGITLIPGWLAAMIHTILFIGIIKTIAKRSKRKAAPKPSRNRPRERMEPRLQDFDRTMS